MITEDETKTLLEVIRTIQWGSPDADACPICGSSEYNGSHRPWCKVGEAMSIADREARRERAETRRTTD